MPDGPKKTCDVLATTRNRAVLPTLAAALQSSSAAVRASAIRAIVRRHDGDSHRLLLRQFDQLAEDEQALLCRAYQAMPHHMAHALKAAVLGSEAALCEKACQIIARCHDYPLFPALVEAVQNRQCPNAAFVTSTIQSLANALDFELATWTSDRAGGNHRGHDPTFARRPVLAALERSLDDYADHQCHELIDAFLLLAPSDNSLLQIILHDERHPCHSSVTAVLAAGSTPGTLHRLVRLLCDTDAPSAVLQAIASRTDTAFIRALFAELKPPVSLRVLHNMKRLKSVAWLEADAAILLDLSGRAQAVAIELAIASGIPNDSQFQILSLMIEKGLAEARRASCQALAKFLGPEATDLVVRALDDPDDGVRAAAVRQLRSRCVPDALKRLVALLDSRSTEVRDAARFSLAEFNFVRFRSMFDLLDENAARATGALVHKVDASARQGLIEELTSPSVAVRLRGIEMCVAMNAAQDMCEHLIELSRNENVALRREAVTALGTCRGSKVEHALRSALQDPQQNVRDAAADALAQLHGGVRTPVPLAVGASRGVR